MSVFCMAERMGRRPAADEQNDTRRFRPDEPPEVREVWVATPAGLRRVAVHASELARPVVPTSVTFTDGGGR
jgi:hypothetical protein